MVVAVRSRVMEGHSLAAALSDFPHIFSELYRATIEAGEQSGHLEVVLERLADYTETRQQISQKMSQESSKKLECGRLPSVWILVFLNAMTNSEE